MPDVSDPQYWSELYRSNEAGWDKGECAPPISRVFREGHFPAGGQVAVIGCGPGHEAFEGARCGFQITAVDFAPEAIAQVRSRSVNLGLVLDAIQADVFDLAHRWPRQFDVIVEHTCLCAIDPARRREYVDAVAGALKPRGILCGLFYAHQRPDGPPYAIHEPEIRQLFETQFDFERLRIASDSFENRAGQELEFIARRRINE